MDLNLIKNLREFIVIEGANGEGEEDCLQKQLCEQNSIPFLVMEF